MQTHQDTASFTETERTLMAWALRRQSDATRAHALSYDSRTHTRPSGETRAVELSKAAALLELAEDIEWGHRR